MEHPDTIALFKYIQEHTPKDAVVVFFKPRAMALFGERRSTGFKVYEDDHQFWSWMETCQADYLFGELVEDEYNWKDGQLVYYAENFARRYPEQFHLVFQNPSFHVYKIRLDKP